MSATRWVVGALIGIALVSGGAALTIRDDGGSGAQPDEGSLARHRPEWSSAWRRAGRIGGEALGAGRIADLTSVGDTIIVAQSGRWFLLTPGSTRGPFGGSVRGDPEWIGRAVSVAFADEVYLLEAGAARVSRWSRTGQRLGTVPLGADGGSFLGEEIAAAPGGRLLVSGRWIRPADSRWLVLYFDGADGAPDTLHAVPIVGPGSGLAVPRITFDGTGRPVVITQSYEIRPDGTPSGWRREDPPLWKVDANVRRSYRRTTERMPAAERIAYGLPEHFPPVRDVAPLRDGGFLVLLSAGAELLTVEVVDGDGRPRGRITDEPLAEPVFLAPDAVYRLREELGETIIEFLPLHIVPEE